ncbi:ArsC family reductase [Chitinibacter bivalviorum]|uniref:ArsC family reductase n=1 Tax=Chitinibacter bivalviorum TaxID=2739434 RepID=A0A7H9BGR9_9NEIS|nr:ArsC family reductase [Chitinibacter bivalviorum]QLG87739.1 ArsC family reductase [Chitinibacter bivalviorum]
MKLFGIPNCDTVKKARTWLSDNGFEYEWHDFKKQGLKESQTKEWITAVGWEILINKQGTTWRKLDDETKASVVDEASAIQLMLTHHSLIKRPVLMSGTQVIVGFKPENYHAQLLK